MKASRVWSLIGAMGATVLIMVILGGSLLAPVTFAATTPPAYRSEVPTSIPPNGVNINNQVTLLPYTPPASPISESQALRIARSYINAQPFPATAVAADVTLQGSVPPAAATETSQATIVENVPSWVITFMAAKATNVTVGGYFPHATTAAHYTPAAHCSVAINALTGQLVVGFFTP